MLAENCSRTNNVLTDNVLYMCDKDNFKQNIDQKPVYFTNQYYNKVQKFQLAFTNGIDLL